MTAERKQRFVPFFSPNIVYSFKRLIIIIIIIIIVIVIIIIVIIIIKNFNRRDSHSHHGSTHRELAQHAHSHGSHAFSHTLYINTVKVKRVHY